MYYNNCMNNYQMLTPSQEAIIKHYLPKIEEVEKLTEFYFALSDITRLKIIMSLCMTPMCVGDLAKVLSINQTTISHQLKILKANKILKCERNKKNITYSISNEYVSKAIECAIDAREA